MRKRMTVTFDPKVYNGLHQKIGKRNISHFLENLARPYVIDQNQDQAYQEMAQDESRESEALEWSENLIQDHI